MRKMLLGVMLFLLLVGCGGNSEKEKQNFSYEDGDELIEQAEEIIRESNSIDGFENASIEYDRFNSYASENGLGGTLIYIDGKILNQTVMNTEENPILALVLEQEDGKRWCVSLSSENELKGIEDKEIRVFGSYLGFSDKFNVPSIGVSDDNAKSKIQVKNESGIYGTIWSFQDYVFENSKEQESKSVSEEVDREESDQQIDSEYNPTMGEINALKKAKSYLEIMAFSYNGLVKQLEYEKFSHEESVYAADNCGADWNEQARIKAKSYLDMMAFSKDSLIEQLEYEGFTHEQAVYGAEQNGY